MGGLGCYFLRLRDCLWNHISHHKRQRVSSFHPSLEREERKETVKNVIYHKHSLQQTTFHISMFVRKSKTKYEKIYLFSPFFTLCAHQLLYSLCPWNAWHSLKLISHVKSLKIHPQKCYICCNRVYLFFSLYFLIASREFRVNWNQVKSLRFNSHTILQKLWAIIKIMKMTSHER